MYLDEGDPADMLGLIRILNQACALRAEWPSRRCFSKIDRRPKFRGAAGSDWPVPARSEEVRKNCAGNRQPARLFQQQPINAPSPESAIPSGAPASPAEAGATHSMTCLCTTRPSDQQQCAHVPWQAVRAARNLQCASHMRCQCVRLACCNAVHLAFDAYQA